MENKVKDGRIKKAGPRSAPVNAATLQPVYRMAGERAPPVASATASVAGAVHGVRWDVAIGHVALANIRQATSVSLLRVKARTVSAHYRRAWRCLVRSCADAFQLRSYRRWRVRVPCTSVRNGLPISLKPTRRVWSLYSSASASMLKAQARLKKANKGGGKLKKDMAKRDAAVDEELNRCLGDGSLYSAVESGVVASADQSAQAVPTQNVMPASYADESSSDASQS